jgi:hypothetical protein
MHMPTVYGLPPPAVPLRPLSSLWEGPPPRACVAIAVAITVVAHCRRCRIRIRRQEPRLVGLCGIDQEVEYPPCFANAAAG